MFISNLNNKTSYLTCYIMDLRITVKENIRTKYLVKLIFCVILQYMSWFGGFAQSKENAQIYKFKLEKLI